MPNSFDITVHRALVVTSSSNSVYVKIPSLLGANESISLHIPSSATQSWFPQEGEQILVGVEGDNFNKVYYIATL